MAPLSPRGRDGAAPAADAGDGLTRAAPASGGRGGESWAYQARPLAFRKGRRTATYVPTDQVHEQAIRGVMARHGWRRVDGPAAVGKDAREPREARDA